MSDKETMTRQQEFKPHLKLAIPSSQYHLDAVLMTCDELSDRASFYIEKDTEKRSSMVLVTFPEEPQSVAAEEFSDLFTDRLQDNKLRLSLEKNNRADREHVVEHALNNPIFSEDRARDQQLPESILKILEEDIEEDDDSEISDPLKIAMSWEEKYGAEDKK